jgi:hypothetical protein
MGVKERRENGNGNGIGIRMKEGRENEAGYG